MWTKIYIQAKAFILKPKKNQDLVELFKQLPTELRQMVWEKVEELTDTTTTHSIKESLIISDSKMRRRTISPFVFNYLTKYDHSDLISKEAMDYLIHPKPEVTGYLVFVYKKNITVDMFIKHIITLTEYLIYINDNFYIFWGDTSTIQSLLSENEN